MPLESALEFVEDDLPEITGQGISEQLDELMHRLKELAATFRSGRLLKEGLKVALVGRPNVGKSSLFNGLLASERAIVTEIPGTTRDSLSEVLNIRGVPVLLTDTAGVRVANDPIEHLGIERTRRAIAESDLVLVVVDGSQPLTTDDISIFAELGGHHRLIVKNKSDLGVLETEDFDNLGKCLTVSAKTGAGLDDLCNVIIAEFDYSSTHDVSFLITSARHFDLLSRAVDALYVSREALRSRNSEDFILVGLYDALRFLGEITGETTPDDVLGKIFSTFCIGK